MEPINEPKAFLECKFETPDVKTDPLCLENYSLGENYKANRLKMSDPSKWSCDQCDYIAANKYSLNGHKRAKHIEIRYPCDQYDYAAPTVWYLEQHRSKHQGIRYACDRCDFTVTDESILRKHKREHIKLKYQCDQCEYCATKSGSLK